MIAHKDVILYLKGHHHQTHKVCNISIINCIIVNNVFEIQDITTLPEYDKYPYTSSSNECKFSFEFLASCIGFQGFPTITLPIADYSFDNKTSISISNSTAAIYKIEITSTTSPTEININFQLSGCGYSGSDSFYPFRYQCHEINISELKFIQTPILYNKVSSYHAYVKVEGNKYPLNINGLYTHSKDEYYALLFCSVTYDYPDENITKNCTNKIIFYNNIEVVLTFDSYFKNSKLNVLGSIVTYPNFTENPNYIEKAYLNTPILQVNYKSDLEAPFLECLVGIFPNSFAHVMYSESDGSINYLIFLNYLDSNPKNITLFYQQSDYGAVGYKAQATQKGFSMPLINMNQVLTPLDSKPDILSFMVSITPSSNYTMSPMTFSNAENINYGISFSFPFGIISSTGYSDFQYNSSFIVSYLFSTIYLGQRYFRDNQKSFTISKIATGISDFDSPIVKNIELFLVHSGYYVLRLEATDQSGLSTLQSGVSEFYNLATFLVNGSLIDGVFEIPLNLFQDAMSIITVFDVYGNNVVIESNEYYSLDPLRKYKDVSADVVKNVYSSLISVSFDSYVMDVTNQDAFNTMYIKIDQSIMVEDIVVIASINRYPITELMEKSYVAIYDNEKKLFYINFKVEKNSIKGPLNYYLTIYPYSNLYIYDQFEENVVLISNTIDNIGPIISSISKLSNNNPVDLNLNSSEVFGWEITIQEQYNGFSHGYVAVRGLSDGSIYNFTLNAYSSRVNTFKLIVSNVSCISQAFRIEQIYLFDTTGIDSVFDRYSSNSITLLLVDYTANPLMNFLGNDDIIQVNVACKPDVEDLSLPVLDSLKPNVSSIDVGAKNRSLSFEIQVSDPESGINTSQPPIVYITSLYFKKIECKSYLKSCNSNYTICTFKCETEIELGFGYPNQLYYQVYGIWNRNGMLSGYNIDNVLKTTGANNISTTYSKNIPIITKTNRITTLDTQLLIIGKSIGNTKSVNIIFENNTSIQAKPNCYYSSYCIIQFTKQYSPFSIQIQTNDNQLSNVYIVKPFIVSIKEAPSSSVSSDSSFEKCPGTPECGGITKGFCTSKGCVCYDPYVGNECQFKTIIVPQPSFNGTDPNITIIVPNDSSSNSQQVQFTSLTSIISLREFDISNNVISTYNFKKWVNNQINSTFNEFYTNFTNINDSDKITQVKVSVQWFNDQTNITFAGSDLSMSASTVKYTIQIKDYPFKSSLNQLQIVMSALFKSNNNQVCSNKDFGDTTGWDDSNYLKIKVGDHSLYARFIKRGIIDSNKIVTLSNSVLDSSFKTIEKSNEMESFIGITVQNFENEFICDPDFSVLLDSSKPSNSICNSSGLSTTQLVGIIIGCVAFVGIAVVCITYFLLKKKQQLKFENKLRSVSSSSK